MYVYIYVHVCEYAIWKMWELKSENLGLNLAKFYKNF